MSDEPYTREELDAIEQGLRPGYNYERWTDDGDPRPLIRRLIEIARAGLADRERVTKLAKAIRRVDWDCSRSPGHPGLDEAKEMAAEILTDASRGVHPAGETK